MDAGHLTAEGGNYTDVKLDENAGADEVQDASGNTLAVTRAKTLTQKDKNKEIKDIEKKLKANAKSKNLSDEEVWELQDKLAELKKTE